MIPPLQRHRLQWPVHPGNNQTISFLVNFNRQQCRQKTLRAFHLTIPTCKVKIQVFPVLELGESDANFAAGVSSASYSTSNMYSQSPWSSTPVVTPPSHTNEPSDFDTSSSAQWHPRAQPGLPGYEFTPYLPSSIPTSRQSSIQDSFSAFHHTQVGEPHDWAHLTHQPLRSMSLANPHDLQNYHSPYQNDLRMLLQRNSTNASNIHPTTLSSNIHPTPPSSGTLSTHGAYAYSEHAQMGASYHSMAPMQSPSMSHPASEAFGHGYYGAPIGLADVREEEETANMQHQIMTGRFRENPG
jgi:hypothetical protein